MMQNILTELIARSIKKADTSYFWEDYTKQAIAVQDALWASEYVIVPKKPSKIMMQAGMSAVVTGRTHVEDLTQKVYGAMIASSEETMFKK